MRGRCAPVQNKGGRPRKTVNKESNSNMKMRDNNHVNTIVGDHNIQINNYGSEDLSMVNKEVLSELVRGVINSHPIRELFRLIHFNPDFPMNHNITKRNLRDRTLDVKTEEGWVKRSYRDFFVKNSGRYQRLLNETFYEIEEELNQGVQNRYNDYMEVMDELDEIRTTPKILDYFKSMMDLIIDHRDMVPNRKSGGW